MTTTRRPDGLGRPGRRHGLRRHGLRAAAGVAGAVVAVLLGGTAASAHIHVDGADATRGGYGMLTFRVPTESDTESTTAIRVTMPKDTPIASASVQPVPGWTATVTTATLDTPVTTDDGEVSSYVSKIVWKADDADSGIRPGEFQQFNVSVGPLPDVAELGFPTLQTYSDGTTVNWNQATTGSAEPEHPAPVLELAAAEEDHHAAATPDTGDAVVATARTSDSATAGLAVGIGAAGIAVVALIIAIVGLLRGSRRGTTGA